MLIVLLGTHFGVEIVVPHRNMKRLQTLIIRAQIFELQKVVGCVVNIDCKRDRNRIAVLGTKELIPY